MISHSTSKTHSKNLNPRINQTLLELWPNLCSEKMNPFVCGSFSSQMEDDDIDELLSPCSTPKRTRKSRDSKNPYANRGLDKFSALLAELEDKKQKIYTQKGSGDISFVRFVYSNSNDWKPIVVKVKDRRQDQHHTNAHVKDKQMTQNSEGLDKHEIEATAPVNEVQEAKVEMSQIPQKKTNKWTWRLNLENIRCPCIYLPLMIVLILLFLAMYGRSFAILCTSVGWYLVPMISKDGSSCPPSKRPKKKEYARRFSEKRMVHEGSSSPKSVLTGPADKSPVKHAHRQSW